MGTRMTPLGLVRHLRVFTYDYRRLYWSEISDAVHAVYPERWCLEWFPALGSVVDEENIYHLWMLPHGWEAPSSMDLTFKDTWRY